ncbi:MAG TPA: hypothetical protein VIK14_05450 [Ignavibacteria bacterium]
MPTLYEFSRKISDLNKEKKYNDALKYFKDNKSEFKNELISGNEYIVAAIITALRHINKYDNAFKFLDLYNIQINNNTKDIILSAYGWLLFSKFKSENKFDDKSIAESEGDFFDDEELSVRDNNHSLNKTDIIEKIELFLPLIINNNDDYSNSVFSNLFIIVLKVEKKKQKPNWKFIIEFCDLFELNQLKTNCSIIDVTRKGVTKKMKLASDKEYWFAYKSKAFMKLGMFKECYDISKQALEAFVKFHYSNDVWFARRIALCKKQLGNSEDAITELQNVLKKKKEWFIQKELADLYEEKGDIENSFKYAMDAINNFGDLEYKVDLLFLIGKLLKGKHELELSFKHFSLSRLIRVNEEWSIPQKLISVLNEFKRDNIPLEKLPELKNELNKYWNNFKSQTKDDLKKQFQVGKIEKILNDNEKGKNGFIKTSDGKSYYFSIKKTEEICESVTIGKEVSFIALPAVDGKREQAINIKLK